MILMHDEAKKELTKKNIKNEIFIMKSKFGKVKLHQYHKTFTKD
jgi:hypothetical protein